jgi:hypothetical protein
MDHGDVKFDGGQGTGQGRVDVPCYDDEARLQAAAHLLEAPHNFRCLHRVASAADIKVEGGLRDVEVLEKDLAHSIVIMLTCMDE